MKQRRKKPYGKGIAISMSNVVGVEVDYKGTPDIESALPKKHYLKREIVYVFLFYVGRGFDFVDRVFTRFMVILKNIDYCKQLFSFEYWLEECLER